MPDSTFLNRVRIKNYRSIGSCDVSLGPLTFLVGPNGSGKSNFLDALRFVADSLRDSLDHAIRERGGIGEVRRRSTGHPSNFAVRLEFSLEAQEGHYSFLIGSRPSGGFEVLNEECVVSGTGHAYYFVRKGELIRHLGMEGTPHGTLRALGVLVSLFQFSNGDGPEVRLVGIEEPETALHPAAAGLLLDVLLEASERIQVIVTSHSPDLLDSKELPTDSILAVVGSEGESQIARVDQAGRDALKEGLCTPGELLRLDQLIPDADAIGGLPRGDPAPARPYGRTRGLGGGGGGAVISAASSILR